MRVETKCSGCAAAVLVLTLEPRTERAKNGDPIAESVARCQARMTRAAGWDFDQAGNPRCPDCQARNTAADAAPAPAAAPARRRKP